MKKQNIKETFYNTVSTHSRCGYLSPNQYEEEYLKNLEKNAVEITSKILLKIEEIREKRTMLFLISQSITLFGSTIVQMAIVW